MPNANDVRGAGNYALSDYGVLVDSNNLTLKANLGVTGGACLDLPNGRVHIPSFDGMLHSFDLTTTLRIGTFRFPLPMNTWVESFVRWGIDGFALLSNGKLYVMRSSAILPPERDQDVDLISDAWEMRYFGTLNVDTAGDLDRDGVSNALEYLLGTSPLQSDGSPLRAAVTSENGQTTLHLNFTRRVGVAAQAYRYEISSDLREWSPPAAVRETVLSPGTQDGYPVQVIDAAIDGVAPTGGFARFIWLGP
jgi:hypothetical protein